MNKSEDIELCLRVVDSIRRGYVPLLRGDKYADNYANGVVNACESITQVIETCLKEREEMREKYLVQS